MAGLSQTIITALADRFPVAGAHAKRKLANGPAFRQDGDDWLIEDNTGRIRVPFIRRYGMYCPTVATRINYMAERYPFSELAGALVIEVGAHVGEFAIYGSPRAAKIISFEPDPVVRRSLVKNIAGLDNVELHPIALSNKSGVAKFYVSTLGADSSLYAPDVYTQVIEVEARRMDSLNIDTNGYRNVFLKMDAEGFEPEVLEGAGDFLKQFTEIAIDVAPERGDQSTYAEVKAIAAAAGLHERSFDKVSQVFYAVRG